MFQLPTLTSKQAGCWVVIAVAALAASFSPLLATTECPKWTTTPSNYALGYWNNEVPLFGDNLTTVLTAAWLLGALTLHMHKKNSSDPMRRSAVWYMRLTIAQAAFNVIVPWGHGVCDDWNDIIYDRMIPMIAFTGSKVCFFAAQLALGLCSLQHLQFNAHTKAARRARAVFAVAMLDAVAAATCVVLERTALRSELLASIHLGCNILGCLLYILFQVNVYLGLRKAASRASEEAQEQGAPAGSAINAKMIANVLALSSSTTLLYCAGYGMWYLAENAMALFTQILAVLDVPSDAVLIVLLGGLLEKSETPTVSTWQKEVGELVVQRRERKLRERIHDAFVRTYGYFAGVASADIVMPGTVFQISEEPNVQDHPLSPGFSVQHLSHEDAASVSSVPSSSERCITDYDHVTLELSVPDPCGQSLQLLVSSCGKKVLDGDEESCKLLCVEPQQLKGCKLRTFMADADFRSLRKAIMSVANDAEDFCDVGPFVVKRAAFSKDVTMFMGWFGVRGASEADGRFVRITPLDQVNSHPMAMRTVHLQGRTKSLWVRCAEAFPHELLEASHSMRSVASEVLLLRARSCGIMSFFPSPHVQNIEKWLVATLAPCREGEEVQATTAFVNWDLKPQTVMLKAQLQDSGFRLRFVPFIDGGFEAAKNGSGAVTPRSTSGSLIGTPRQLAVHSWLPADLEPNRSGKTIVQL